MPENVQVGVMLPGEAALIALLDLIRVIVDGQPPEVKAQLWGWYVEDMKAWREFWKGKT